jgi:hypothetical protein
MTLFNDRRLPFGTGRSITGDDPISADEADKIIDSVHRSSGVHLRGNHIVLPGGLAIPASNQYITTYGGADPHHLSADLRIPTETGHLHTLAVEHHPDWPEEHDDDEMHLTFWPDREQYVRQPKQEDVLYTDPSLYEPMEGFVHVPKDRFAEALSHRLSNPAHPMSPENIRLNAGRLRDGGEQNNRVRFVDYETKTYQDYDPRRRSIHEPVKMGGRGTARGE